MRIPPTFVATAQRWAASWWSLGAQVGTWLFYLAMLINLFVQRVGYERGVIPASMFQGPDVGPWLVSNPEDAMRGWYITVTYLGFCVIAGPILLVACWRLRCRLRERSRSAVADIAS